jgi:Ser/Thr protein kinase RdoA (MazF antagonist)
VLLPEGGRPLGETAEGEELAEGLAAALGRYALLQQQLAGDVDELLRLGVDDMRPEAMPARFDQALAAVERYVIEHGDDRDRASLERIHQRRDWYAGLAAELAARPGGASLDHNDLHPWNILGDAGESETLRFYDWGDSVVAHPFAATLVPLGFAARRSQQHLERARDTYLAGFADVGPHPELVETLELACGVAKVARALTWNRAMSAAGEADDVDPDFARAPLASLESLLDDSYLGGA